MATEFPNNFDVFPTLVDNVDDILAVHQNNRADAIEALESKVGVTSSPTTTSHDYLLRNLPAQDGSVIISNLNAALLGGAAKDADGTLAGNSDSSIPTEKAVKTYVDAHKDDIADAHDASAISVVDEFVHSSSTNVQDVLDDVDVALTSHQNDDVDSTNIVHGIRQGAGNGFDADKLDGAHKDIDETLSGNSDLSIPSEKAVKTYVDTNINVLGTASLVDTGTAAGDVPLNSDLGTASLVDTGTGAGEVPLNSDLDWSADITVTVGSGGDYATINAALAALVKRKPLYDNSGITATINLLAGFVMAEQVLVRGLDLGWVTITGADAETTITNTALTTDFTTADYGFNSYPAFGVSKGGVLPRIDQLFRFDVANVGGYKHGIMAIGAGSSADVLNGCGVKDAGDRGILADQGSTINAAWADVSGAGNSDIAANRGSTINANNATASSYFPTAANTVTANGIIFRLE